MNTLHFLTDHPPMTVAHQLDASVRSLERATQRYLDPDDPSIVKLLAAADQLAKTDALEASHLKGRIHTLTGRREPVDYWFNNAQRLNGGWKVLHDHCACLLNLGHFAAARELLPTLLTLGLDALPRAAEMAVIAGDLSGALTAFSQLKRNECAVDDDVVGYATVGLNVIALSGCTEECAWRILDVAGEVLREARLFWTEPRPDFLSYDGSISDDGGGFLYTMYLPVPMAAASRLGLDFVSRLIARDLCMNSFKFCFSGATFEETVEPLTVTPKVA